MTSACEWRVPDLPDPRPSRPCAQDGMLPLHYAFEYGASEASVKAVLAANPEAAKEKDKVRVWRACAHGRAVAGARGGHGGGAGARGEMALGPHAPSVAPPPLACIGRGSGSCGRAAGGGRRSGGAALCWGSDSCACASCGSRPFWHRRRGV